MCEELEKVINQQPFFNCVGGCGVDLSNGKSQCMSASGVWFKFCPFCGKKIVSKQTKEVYGGSWEWFEE